MAPVNPDEHAQPAEAETTSQQGVFDLTTGSVPRLLVSFALPMLAGNALQTAYSIVNAFWVGRFLGPDAFAALTVSLPSLFVLISVAGGLTLATNIMVAQDVGAHDLSRVRKAVQTSTVLVIGLSFILLALGEAFTVPLLRQVMNTPPEIFSTALSYTRIILLTLPLSFATFLIASVLRGLGDSRTPVYFQSFSLLLNMILDPLLIRGLGGFPHLGLNGAAWATVIAQAAVVIALLAYIPGRRPLAMPRQLRIDRLTAWLLFRIGVPSMIQFSVVSLSLVLITRLVSSFGTATDAAFGAAIRMDNVAFLPAMSIGMAVSTLSGQNIGAKKYDRVPGVLRWGILLSAGITALIAAAVFLYPAAPLQFFLGTGAANAGVIAIGAVYLRIMCLTYVFYAVMFASNGVINGAGHTLVTTAVTAIALLVVRLGSAYLLVAIFHSPVFIWYAMLASVGVGMILSLAYYSTGKWKVPLQTKFGSVTGK